MGGWKLGKLEGKGEFKWPDGKRYNGDYKQDIKHGYGKFEWPDGSVYEGNWE